MKALALALALVWTSLASAQPAPTVRVEATTLIVDLPDGRQLRGAQLIGAMLVGPAPEGSEQAFRIDRIWPDPADRDGDVLLYEFSVRDPRSGEWKPACAPDATGLAAGFPLAGSWSFDGRHLHDDHYSLTCTSGVIGKCVRFGYKPWKRRTDGTALWDIHQACTRMLRADYCGDGRGHTRNGTLVEIVDKLGLLTPSPSGPATERMSFEAAWTKDGASCVAKPRLTPSPWSLEEIVGTCPERLADGAGRPKVCDPEVEKANPAVVLLNRS